MGDATPPRARWARLVALAAWSALVVHACREGERLEAYSVQLHVHGSFSEGLGSMDSHSFEAAALGLDVLWWSDHDFRMTGRSRVSRFGFEDWSEPIDRGERWRAQSTRHRAGTKSLSASARSGAAQINARFLSDPPAREGERSLELSVEHSGPEFRTYPLVFDSSRRLHTTALATRPTLRLAIYPHSAGPNARPFVTVMLSEHAPREGIGLEPYALRYFLSNDVEAPFREGAVFHVPIRFESGRWNELVLPLFEDVQRGFPLTPPGDNSLYRLVFGVEARSGALARASFDDLRIETEISGAPVFELQREVMSEVGALHPRIEQLQGAEISFASRHLNEFSLDTRLPDYEALVREVGRDPQDPNLLDDAELRRAIVGLVIDDIHERGGLVSYNHMFGIDLEGGRSRRTKEEQLAMFRERGLQGVDILEVGYRDRGGASLADHLWVWDQLALDGLRLVGTGVSDSHGGPNERWSGRPNNFVSWIYAQSPAKVDLLEGLRGGRVFFGDLERFDGGFDLVTGGGARMGEVVSGAPEGVSIEVLVDGAQLGDALVLIFNAAPLKEWLLDRTRGSFVHTLPAAAGDHAFVRAELRAGTSGAAYALTNPIYFER